MAKQYKIKGEDTRTGKAREETFHAKNDSDAVKKTMHQMEIEPNFMTLYCRECKTETLHEHDALFSRKGIPHFSLFAMFPVAILFMAFTGMGNIEVSSKIISALIIIALFGGSYVAIFWLLRTIAHLSWTWTCLTCNQQWRRQPSNKSSINLDQNGPKKLRIICPECGHTLRDATSQMIGDIGVCPKCKAEFVISSTEAGILSDASSENNEK